MSHSFKSNKLRDSFIQRKAPASLTKYPRPASQQILHDIAVKGNYPHPDDVYLYVYRPNLLETNTRRFIENYSSEHPEFQESIKLLKLTYGG